MFGLVVNSSEARSADDTVITRDGDAWWVCIEDWVEASGRRVSRYENPPEALKTFSTPAEAEAFAKRWTGHPWYCRPNGKFQVVEVIPRTVRVLDGYDRV